MRMGNDLIPHITYASAAHNQLVMCQVQHKDDKG
jgi:hypothetical protein